MIENTILALLGQIPNHEQGECIKYIRKWGGSQAEELADFVTFSFQFNLWTNDWEVDQVRHQWKQWNLEIKTKKAAKKKDRTNESPSTDCEELPAIAKLSPLLKKFLDTQDLRRTLLYQSLRPKTEAQQLAFLQFIEDWGTEEEKMLHVFVASFLKFILWDKGRTRQEFYKLWKDDPFNADTLEEAIKNAEVIFQTYKEILELRHSQFYKCVKLMQDEERIRFRQFVSFITGDRKKGIWAMRIQIFFDYVVKGKGISRRQLWNFWNPDSIDDPKWSHKQSQQLGAAMQFLENYLAYAELRKDQRSEDIMVAKAIMNRGWHQDLSWSNKQAIEKNNLARHDDELHFRKMKLEDFEVQVRMKSRQSLESPPLGQCIQNLEDYFLVKSLRYVCAALDLDQNRNTNHQEKIKRLNGFLQQFDLMAGNLTLVAKLFVAAREMLINPMDPKRYENLRDSLWHNVTRIDTEIARELFDFLINRCVRNINEGKSEYQNETESNYQLADRHGLLLNNGLISGKDLINRISYAIQYGKDLREAINFLFRYRNLLNPISDPYTFPFIIGQLRYHQKKYQQAWHKLDQTRSHTKEPLLKLAAWVILVRAKTEYALQLPSLAQATEIKEVISVLKNMKSTLSRKDFAHENHVAVYKGFQERTLRLLEILDSLPLDFRGHDKKRNNDINKVISKLNKKKLIASKSWILEMARATIRP